jgi:hypothetical protein
MCGVKGVKMREPPLHAEAFIVGRNFVDVKIVEVMLDNVRSYVKISPSVEVRPMVRRKRHATYDFTKTSTHYPGVGRGSPGESQGRQPLRDECRGISAGSATVGKGRAIPERDRGRFG